MGKKEFNLVSKILLNAIALDGLISPIVNLREFRKVMIYGANYDSYRNTINKLIKRGWIKKIDKNGKKFLKLTRDGQLEALVSKMKLEKNEVKIWDGKWRIVIFDIPEAARLHRDKLRWLLKRNGFMLLQASVFISPYALNRESLDYLRMSKLIGYIRILKVEELDNDSDMRRLFKLDK